MHILLNPIKLIIVLITSLLPAISVAEDLYSIYQLALLNDPTFLAAEERQLAQAESLPQARASLLPSLNATADKRLHHQSTTTSEKYSSNQYQLLLTQPIINFPSWNKYSYAESKVAASKANLAAAKQDIIIRVATQYFAILNATDSLKLAKGQLKAFDKQLNQAKQRFSAGMAAKTNVNEAQARRDNAFAQEIAATNTIENEYEVLRELISKNVTKVLPLKKEIKLQRPDPNNMEQWVTKATANNLLLQAKRFDRQAAKNRINQERTEHLPYVDLTGSISKSKNESIKANPHSKNKQIGLTLTMPIFSGGGMSSRTTQVIHEHQAIQQDFEKQYRLTQSNTRQAYREILTKISEIKALKQAVASNKSALKATSAAFDVGTRTMVDVLNAEHNLLTAEKNYASSRYNYLLATLKLKETAGTLSDQDLKQINSWFN